MAQYSLGKLASVLAGVGRDPCGSGLQCQAASRLRGGRSKVTFSQSNFSNLRAYVLLTSRVVSTEHKGCELFLFKSLFRGGILKGSDFYLTLVIYIKYYICIFQNIYICMYIYVYS